MRALSLAIGSAVAMCLLAWCSSGHAQSPGTAPPGGPAESGAIADIIVTASKREEKLSNVAASVDALSSDTIQTLGISKIDDYVGLIPNLNQVSQGAPGNSTIVIRGIYTGTASLTSTTAYYLDEAALTASATDAAATYIAPDADLADVDHVEVLKGPQSTLYGANALGGVLRVITKKPDLNQTFGTVSGGISGVDGGGLGFETRASLNTPIADGLAAIRINVFERRDPGYVTNLGTGHTDINDADIRGGRIAIRVEPFDNLTIDLNGLYQEIQANSVNNEYDREGTITPAFGRYTFNSSRDLPSRSYYRSVGTTIEYKTDFGSFTSATGYASYNTKVISDGSRVFAPLLAEFAQPGAQSFESVTASNRKTTSETRFASERLGPVEFIAGFFYTYEDADYESNAPVVNPDGSVPTLFNTLIHSPNPASYQEYAGYGDVTFYLTDDIDLTGGFRYSKNHQTINSQTFGFFSLFFPNRHYVYNGDSRNYLATLRWRPDEDTNLYFRAASGYRPGGPNIGALSFGTFGADQVWNYEVGAKGSLFDRRLSYSVAGYHVDWSNTQLPGTDPVSGSQIVLNGGGAEINGAELELSARPARGLSLNGAFGYNDAHLTQVGASTEATLGAKKGDQLPLSSRYTGSGILDYTTALNDEFTLGAGATYRYLGSRNSSFPDTVLNPNVRIPAATTIDLRTSLTYLDKYRLSFRIQNLTNNEGIGSYTATRLFPGQPGVYGISIRNQPRTFYADLGVDF